jgi:hypothetical protein
MALDYSRSRQASIAIEIDPVDATGSATKKRVTVWSQLGRRNIYFFRTIFSA